MRVYNEVFGEAYGDVYGAGVIVVPVVPVKKPLGGSFSRIHEPYIIYPRIPIDDKARRRRKQEQDDLMIVKLLTEFLSRV